MKRKRNKAKGSSGKGSLRQTPAGDGPGNSEQVPASMSQGDLETSDAAEHRDDIIETAKHLRFVHFTLFLASFGLFVAVVQGPDSKVPTAIRHLKQIQRLSWSEETLEALAEGASEPKEANTLHLASGKSFPDRYPYYETYSLDLSVPASYSAHLRGCFDSLKQADDPVGPSEIVTLEDFRSLWDLAARTDNYAFLLDDYHSYRAKVVDFLERESNDLRLERTESVQTLTVWRVRTATGAIDLQLAHEARNRPVECLAVLENGSEVTALSRDQEAHIYSADHIQLSEPGSVSRSQTHLDDVVGPFALSPDATLLVSTDPLGTVYFHSAKTGRPARGVDWAVDNIDQIFFTADGARLVAFGEGDVVVFSGADYQESTRYDVGSPHYDGVVGLHGPSRLLVAGKKLRVIDLAAESIGEGVALEDGVRSNTVCSTESGAFAAVSLRTGDGRNLVQVFRAEDWEMIWEREFDSVVDALALTDSPDGTPLLATGDREGNVGLWGSDEGSLDWSKLGSPITHLDFASNGGLLLARARNPPSLEPSDLRIVELSTAEQQAVQLIDPKARLGRFVIRGQIDTRFRSDDRTVFVPIEVEQVPIDLQDHFMNAAGTTSSWIHGSFEHSFRELTLLTTHIRDTSLPQLQAFLETEERRLSGTFTLFGIELSADLVRTFGIYLLIGIQSYLWLHLQAFCTRLLPVRRRVWFPWIALYDHRPAQVVVAISTCILPVVTLFVLIIGEIGWRIESEQASILSTAILCLIAPLSAALSVLTARTFFRLRQRLKALPSAA